jgi:hypothetical protein
MEKTFERSISIGGKAGKSYDVAKRMVVLGIVQEAGYEDCKGGYTKYAYIGEAVDATLYDTRLGIPELVVRVADLKAYKALRAQLKLDRSGRLTD